MPIFSLTENFINEQFETNVAKRIEWCDSVVRGLYLELRAAKPGSGVFRLRYKTNAGKTCHQPIGSTEDTTLKEARKKAKELKAEISLGRDPRGEERAKQAIITLDQFYNDHYLPFATPRKKSIKRDMELYVRLKKEFGHLPLNRITRRQMQTFHTGLLEKEKLSPASCNHHIKLLRRMCSIAVSFEMLTTNPASRFPLFFENNQIENYLDKEQLEKLLTVLRTHQNRAVCNIALFLLCTGARLNEVLLMTHLQIDRPNRTWKIPASNSKSRKVRAIPLNDSALAVLDAQAALDDLDSEGEFDHVFINRKTGKPYKNIHKSWCRIKEKAGLPHLRLHDLRHQYASFLVNSGRTLYEVQQILGHSNPTVTMRYAHLSTKTLQEAANSASDMIKGASSAADSTAA